MKKALAYLIALTMLLCSLPAISFADAAEPTTVTIATTWQVPEYFGETNENKLLLEKENKIGRTSYSSPCSAIPKSWV